MLIITRSKEIKPIEDKPDLLYDFVLGHLGIDSACVGRARKDRTEMLASNCADLLKEMYPQADAIYEDAIIELVGEAGLMALREMRMVESCGSIYGRKLYAFR